MKNKIKIRSVDVLIFGAGTAGLNALRAAEGKGASAVIIHTGQLGTTCARVGCMPSKLLIAASELVHHTHSLSKSFGLRSSLKIQDNQVLARVQRERDRFVSFVLKDTKILKNKNKLIKGRAKFIDAHTVKVNSNIIKAKTIIFSTGTSPVIPKLFDRFPHRILTNENVFDLKRLPKSVLVLGTGPIGLELGQALHFLGVKVTVLGHRGIIGHLSDPKLLKCADKTFSSVLDFHPDSKITKVSEVNQGVKVSFLGRKKKSYQKVYEKVLVAAGRNPNLDIDELRGIGISPDADGHIQVNPKTMQFKKSHFYFAGDVAGERKILHEASHEGQIAGINAALFPKSVRIKRMVPFVVIFSNPQIALVGKIWKDIQKNKKVIVGEVDFSDQGRSRVMGLNKGMVRLYADSSKGILLGGEMFGPRMEHMAHLLAWVIEQKLTVKQILKMPFYHPTFEEGLRTAFRDLARKVK